MGQFLLINGKSLVKRQIESNPAAPNPVAAQAVNAAGDGAAVDTSERFGLISSLIQRHKMRHAMQHGMMPGMYPGAFGFIG